MISQFKQEVINVCAYLHQAGCHVACVLPRLVVDIGRHLDDLARCVALHVSLGLQDYCACFHQHVGELLGHCRRTDSLQGERGSINTSWLIGLTEHTSTPQ